MLFNSLEYLLFLPIVYLLYWSLQEHLRIQNVLLLLASYFFYGLWDYRFLSLIILSSVTDYIIGIQLEKSDVARTRKSLLAVSLIVNLGLLAVFKYFNFFIDSFTDLVGLFGLNANVPLLKIVLPVGISFYTFQTLSYTIDVYRKKLKPTKSLLNFCTYVAFFPQLVAGPIERASSLLPQIEAKRQFSFESSKDGLRQILWGLFKKVVIADSCAVIVDSIFSSYHELWGPVLVLGAVLFAFQIYCDFSGYSDIAIGTSRLMGINLMQNFATPYFARDVAEFWRRWHISLSTWFRDYLYIPLGGSRVGKALQFRNVFAIFLVSGFWHGANWTYMFWGLIHALCYVPQLISKTNRNYIEVVAQGKLFPRIGELGRILTTFSIVTLAWIFFRSASIGDSFSYIRRMITQSNISFGEVLSSLRVDPSELFIIAFFVSVMLFFEWLSRDGKHGLAAIGQNVYLRFTVYLFLCLCVLDYFNGETAFIYFQF